MPIVQPELIESQVDWLTVTSGSSTEDPRLLQVGHYICKNLLREDPTICEWAWRGYTGTRGQHFAFGSRWDSTILQLGGELADPYFDLAYNRATKCTRIDLAITVRYDGGREGVARDGYRAGLDWDRKHGQTRERTYIQSHDGGSTAYTGNRKSDLYARLYDKWREDGGERYKWCWRWEVEAKGDIAGRISARLNSTSDRRTDIRDIVSTHFQRRGGFADWMASSGKVSIQLKRPPSGSASRLAWLGNSVRPVVRKLLPVVGSEGVIEALGLDAASVHAAQLAWYDKLDSHRLGGCEEA